MKKPEIVIKQGIGEAKGQSNITGVTLNLQYFYCIENLSPDDYRLLFETAGLA